MRELARTKLLELIFCTDIFLPWRKIRWLIGQRKKELKQVCPNHCGLFLSNETYSLLANWIPQHCLDYLAIFRWSYYLQLIPIFSFLLIVKYSGDRENQNLIFLCIQIQAATPGDIWKHIHIWFRLWSLSVYYLNQIGSQC